MASEESKRIRAMLVKESDSVDVSLDVERQQWEASAAQMPLPLGTIIESLVVDGINCERVSCGSVDRDKVMLFLHGGGFNSGSCKTHRELAARLSLATKIPTMLMDYRLAPEYPFPAAIEDIATAYRWLISNGTRPDQIALGGDSAGGGLVVSSLLYLRNYNDPMPAAAVLLSAWLDLTMSSESMLSRAEVDPIVTRQALLRAAKFYVGDHNPKNPLISPVYADLQGLPPLLIHVGDHEILLSDSVRLTEKARIAGVEVILEVRPEMWHVWHSWAASMPEAQQALIKIGKFVGTKLGLHT